MATGTEETTARLGASERNRDKLGLIVGFHSHDHRVLAALLRITDGFAHIRGGSNFAGADLEDDVASLSP